ncbi:hypothetical protein [Methylobacterium sp. WCS2018Hpa-22]|uniref:hypothetical protein n=1 Tax=Methylobacterium sp. WCS2018Hpa-22 TaxID=3073633 RepID=UPI002889DC69|nr:hypothetical protein [Methylobacterium sp. WCS2018Hpa-22]
MTNTNEIIRDLGIRLIRAEIKARQPKDAKAVEDAIATRIRIDSVGSVYVVDTSGNRVHSKSFEQFMDEVSNDRPELFNGRPSNPGVSSSSSVKGNPFMKGSPGYNLSEGMKLYRTDPETAKELAFQAGMKL